MARIELLAAEVMTEAQRAACEEVLAGKRGKIPSPMIAWLRNPEMAGHAQRLGEVLRFKTSLEPLLVEIAIIVVAATLKSHQVWTSHRRYASQFGLSDEAIMSIAAGEEAKLPTADQRLVQEAARGLVVDHRLSDALYKRLVTTFGEQGVVELVAVVGYYCLVALTANAFELGLPQNEAKELDTSPRSALI